MDDEYDYCCECAAYDNNYFYNKKTGEWESACPTCSIYSYRYGDDRDD